MRRLPTVVPNTESNNAVTEVPTGAAVEPLIFAKMNLLVMADNAVLDVPQMVFPVPSVCSDCPLAPGPGGRVSVQLAVAVPDFIVVILVLVELNKRNCPVVPAGAPIEGLFPRLDNTEDAVVVFAESLRKHVSPWGTT